MNQDIKTYFEAIRMEIDATNLFEYDDILENLMQIVTKIAIDSEARLKEKYEQESYEIIDIHKSKTQRINQEKEQLIADNLNNISKLKGSFQIEKDELIQDYTKKVSELIREKDQLEKDNLVKKTSLSKSFQNEKYELKQEYESKISKLIQEKAQLEQDYTKEKTTSNEKFLAEKSELIKEHLGEVARLQTEFLKEKEKIATSNENRISLITKETENNINNLGSTKEKVIRKIKNKISDLALNKSFYNYLVIFCLYILRILFFVTFLDIYIKTIPLKLFSKHTIHYKSLFLTIVTLILLWSVILRLTGPSIIRNTEWYIELLYVVLISIIYYSLNIANIYLKIKLIYEKDYFILWVIGYIQPVCELFLLFILAMLFKFSFLTILLIAMILNLWRCFYLLISFSFVKD